MPKLPRLTAPEAERMLLSAGFSFIRSRGSHRIYMKNNRRIIIPFHKGKIQHPKIVQQVYKAIKDED